MTQAIVHCYCVVMFSTIRIVECVGKVGGGGEEGFKQGKRSQWSQVQDEHVAICPVLRIVGYVDELGWRGEGCDDGEGEV